MTFGGKPASGYDSLSISRDKRRLASCHTSGIVCVWEVTADWQDARLSAKLPANPRGYARVVFLDEHGDSLATACRYPGDPAARDTFIHIWNVNAGTEEVSSRYAHHDGAITSLAVDATYERLASGSEDGTIGLWHIDHSHGASQSAMARSSVWAHPTWLRHWHFTP